MKRPQPTISILIAIAALALAAASRAHAQYLPIPNYQTAPGQVPSAGTLLLGALNARFGGQAAISPLIVQYPFASLPVETDGALYWCSDCVKATPCAGAGSGAFAFGARGQWSCGYNTLEQDLNGGGHNISNANVNGVLNALTFAGADLFAQINAAMASPGCPTTGCVIDATQASGNLAISTGLVITKPVRILLSGNLTYSGAAIAGGLIQFNAGSSDSSIQCAGAGAWNLDSGDNGLPSTGNPCAVQYAPGSGSGPLMTIAAGVMDITVRNIALIGNSNVTDGIQHNGSFRLTVDHVLFSCYGASCGGGKPTGWAVNGTTGDQDGSQLTDFVVHAWAGGFRFYADPGGTFGPRIEHGFMYDCTQGWIALTDTFDARISAVEFAYGKLAASTPGILITSGTGSNVTPHISNVHFDGSNMLGNTGVIDIQFTGSVRGGSIADSSLHGNTNDSISTHDPDHAVDLGSGVYNVLISGNDIGNYLNGGIETAGTAANQNAAYNNYYAAGSHGGGPYIISGAGLASAFADAAQMPMLLFNTIYAAAGTAVPAAASYAHGRLCVSDSTACTAGTTYASGGAAACELYSNGTNWIESGAGC